jgi:hypothetical protein
MRIFESRHLVDRKLLQVDVFGVGQLPKRGARVQWDGAVALSNEERDRLRDAAAEAESEEQAPSNENEDLYSEEEEACGPLE